MCVLFVVIFYYVGNFKRFTTGFDLFLCPLSKKGMESQIGSLKRAEVKEGVCVQDTDLADGC